MKTSQLLSRIVFGLLVLCMLGYAQAEAPNPELKPSDLVTHGPWLTYPDPGEITIGFTTVPGCGAGVEYREVGTDEWKQAWHTVAGQIFRHRTARSIRLAGLKKNGEYEYRLILFVPQDKKYHEGSFPKLDNTHKTKQVVLVENPDFRFRTFTDAPEPFTFSVAADLQFSRDVKLRLLRDFHDKCGLKDSKFFAVIGDGHNDIRSMENSYIGTVIDGLQPLGGASRPALFIRGNHEWRGGEASLWTEYFPAPETRSTYFTFQCGDTFFIVLDSGEDKPATTLTYHYTGNNIDDQAFREEQRIWLAKVVETPAFKSAKWRIVLCHSAIYSHGGAYMYNHLAHICQDLFKKDKPQNRIHLWLSGHTHLYSRTIPGADQIYRPYRTRPYGKVYGGKDYDFTVLTVEAGGKDNVENSLVNVTVDKDKISVEARTPDNALMDAFEIKNDGTVVDLNNDTLLMKKSPASYK